MRPENGCPWHLYFAYVDSLTGDFTSFLRVNSVVIVTSVFQWDTTPIMSHLIVHNGMLELCAFDLG